MINTFENAIAFSQGRAEEIGEWEPPAYFLRVPDGLGPQIVGAVEFWLNPQTWEGTPEQVEHAVQIVFEFLAQPGETLEEILTACPWYGANFRLNEEGELEAQQGLNLPPPPWEFRLTQGEDGANLEFRTVPT